MGLEYQFRQRVVLVEDVEYRVHGDTYNTIKAGTPGEIWKINQEPYSVTVKAYPLAKAPVLIRLDDKEHPLSAIKPMLEIPLHPLSKQRELTFENNRDSVLDAPSHQRVRALRLWPEGL